MTQSSQKPSLYFICTVAALGGLLFGYDWVVIGGAKPFYEAFFGIADNPVMQGIAMTTANIGCLLGAMLAGALAISCYAMTLGPITWVILSPPPCSRYRILWACK